MDPALVHDHRDRFLEEAVRLIVDRFDPEQVATEKDVVGTVVRQALREGKVFYDRAA